MCRQEAEHGRVLKGLADGSDGVVELPCRFRFKPAGELRDGGDTAARLGV